FRLAYACEMIRWYSRLIDSFMSSVKARACQRYKISNGGPERETMPLKTTFVSRTTLGRRAGGTAVLANLVNDLVDFSGNLVRAKVLVLRSCFLNHGPSLVSE